VSVKGNIIGVRGLCFLVPMAPRPAGATLSSRSSPTRFNRVSGGSALSLW
jgi:hypothetical protein